MQGVDKNKGRPHPLYTHTCTLHGILPQAAPVALYK